MSRGLSVESFVAAQILSRWDVCPACKGTGGDDAVCSPCRGAGAVKLPRIREIGKRGWEVLREVVDAIEGHRKRALESVAGKGEG